MSIQLNTLSINIQYSVNFLKHKILNKNVIHCRKFNICTMVRATKGNNSLQYTDNSTTIWIYYKHNINICVFKKKV